MLTGYKTLIASGVVAVLGVLQAADWVTLISTPKAFGWAALGSGILFAVLRAVTTTPVGGSGA